MVATVRSKQALLDAAPGTFQSYSNADLLDSIASMYPQGTVLATAHLAEQANTVTGQTLALNNAIAEAIATLETPRVKFDWGGTLDINEEVLVNGNNSQNIEISGLNMFRTHLRQTTANKGGIIMKGTATSNAIVAARCRITDLKISHQTQQTNAQTQAFGIGWENSVTDNNAFLGFDVDRFFIEGFCYGMGLRQPSGGGVGVTLWGSHIAKTWGEIHNTARTGLYWYNDVATGQPENKLGNLYIQGGPGYYGVGAGTYPAVILQAVELAGGSLGIEDWDDKLIEMYGDEGFDLQLLHFERNNFSGDQPFVYLGHNTLKIGVVRCYAVGGSGSGHMFQLDGDTSYLDVGSITTKDVTNASGDLVLVKTGGSGWKIGNYKPVGSNPFLPYRASDTAARYSCIEYDGKWVGKVYPVTVAANDVEITPTGEIVALTVTGSARTGGRMSAGTIEGERRVIKNLSAFDWTFHATPATSRVKTASLVVTAGTQKNFTWDAADALWYAG